MQFHLAVIEINKACNLKCKHCYSFFESDNTAINIDDFSVLCEQLSFLGVNMITITGGEPMLLGKNIKEYIKISKRFFKIINMTTNGTLLTENNVKYINRINNVQVSIDGPEKIHDYIRGKGNFYKAVNSVKILKLNEIPCSIMMTVNDYNFLFLEDVYKISKKLDVSMGFERITSIGRGKNSLFLSKSNFKKLIKYSCKLGIESTDPLCSLYDVKKRNYLLRNKIRAGCMAGNMAIVIDADMNLLPCARLRIILGNVKTKKIIDVLRDSKIIKRLNDRRLLKGKCNKCNYKLICGGCRAAAYAFSGNYLNEDPDCFIK